MTDCAAPIQGWLDLARTMDARPRAVLLQIRLPAALPAFASGARIAAAVAPIGAVIGEWVGASAGLGYLMTQSLARGQTRARLRRPGRALPARPRALLRDRLGGRAVFVPWQSQGE